MLFVGGMMGDVKKLKYMRECFGWSRLRLAREAGLNHWDVIKIEAGKLDPTEEQLGALARALHVDPNRCAWLMESYDEETVTRRGSQRAADCMDELLGGVSDG